MGSKVASYIAYFDESGTHDGSEAVAVAGYVSTADRWVDFAAEWQAALNDDSLDLFHMSDLSVGAPPFDKWTTVRRRQRFQRYLRIIERHALASVGIVIPRKAFDATFTPRLRAICGGAYGLAAAACFMDLAETLRDGKLDGGVSYVFESGAKGRREIEKVFEANYRDLRQREVHRLVSLRFDDKRRLLPLQAADVLAYELYRHLPRQLGWEARPARRFHLEPLAVVPHSWGYLNVDELKKWAEVLSVRAAMEDAGELKPL